MERKRRKGNGGRTHLFVDILLNSVRTRHETLPDFHEHPEKTDPLPPTVFELQTVNSDFVWIFVWVVWWEMERNGRPVTGDGNIR